MRSNFSFTFSAIVDIMNLLNAFKLITTIGKEWMGLFPIQMENVREKVLNAAKELFIQQGYKKTTILQIVDRSGVLTGSIYHFFKNKEDIFKTLVLDLFDMGDSLVVESLDTNISPGLRTTILCTLELIAVELDERICELYYEAYNSNFIFESLVTRGTEFAQTLFREYNPSFAYDDYYVRVMAIKGVLRSFISHRYLHPQTSLLSRFEVFVDIGLQAFNVPLSEIDQVKSDLAGMTNQLVTMAVNLTNEQMAFMRKLDNDA